MMCFNPYSKHLAPWRVLVAAAHQVVGRSTSPSRHHNRLLPNSNSSRQDSSSISSSRQDSMVNNSSLLSSSSLHNRHNSSSNKVGRVQVDNSRASKDMLAAQPLVQTASGPGAQTQLYTTQNGKMSTAPMNVLCLIAGNCAFQCSLHVIVSFNCKKITSDKCALCVFLHPNAEYLHIYFYILSEMFSAPG